MDEYNNNGYGVPDGQPDYNAYNNNPAPDAQPGGTQDYPETVLLTPDMRDGQQAGNPYGSAPAQGGQSDYREQYNNAYGSAPAQNGQSDYREQYNNTYGTAPRQDDAQPYNAAPQQSYAQPYNAAPQQDYAQQYPTYQAQPMGIKDGKATASMVLGIIALVLGIFCCCFYGIPGLAFGIPGLILGIVSKKDRPANGGMATAGIVMSAIAIGLGLVSLVVVIAAGGFAEMVENAGYNSYYYY